MKSNPFFSFAAVLILSAFVSGAYGQTDTVSEHTQLYPVGKGWAKNSVNAVIFRQNSVTSYEDTQYTAYYDSAGTMILAKRKHGSSQWTIHRTQFRADVEDAHNSISIAVDGDGILHVAWGMHGDELRYARSEDAGSLKLTYELPMTGGNEDAVTYPQFYRLSGGDLLFMYRSGSSGSGNIMINRYILDTGEWKNVHHPLIDGEGERNAYINPLSIDREGGWHISWTWRETWDVSTNHDILYAYSPDEGKTWLNSKGEEYSLPITADNAEIVFAIPQRSELINQTSMTINSNGEPVVATYWRTENSEVPQFRIVWRDGDGWKSSRVGKRTLGFSLSGGGTKRIPISRPLIAAGEKNDLYVIYRDFERGGGISVAISKDEDYTEWEVRDIYSPQIGLWEPTFDIHAWQKFREIHLFGQRVEQGDNEQIEEIEPQQVFILRWIPPLYRR